MSTGTSEPDTGLIPLPEEVRDLLAGPNYVHLSTLQADGSPRSHVVWAGLEGDRILVCTYRWYRKAADMYRDPRVALSVTDLADPYRMASVQGRVVEIRPDEDYRHMDRIAVKYTSAPFPSRASGHVAFVIGATKAYQRTLSWFTHAPGASGAVSGT